MIALKRIDTKNIWKVVKLTVTERQKDFVATNAESILEAYATVSEGNVALPLAIYDDDMLIGFVMFGYGLIGEEDEPQIADGNYCIWRFMIDQKYQGHGRGRAALAEAIKYIRTMPVGTAEFCWLSYEPDNDAARSLYASVGFVENGEMSGDETVAVMRL